MMWPGSILTTPMTLTPWDVHETRGERHLLVWGDLPLWMVIDTELLMLLERFDGKTSARQAAGSDTPPGELKSICKDLLRKGVLHKSRRAGRPKNKPTPHRIESISINLTHACNLQCSFCYDAGMPLETDALDADEIARFLHQAKPLFGTNPTLFLLGGEPFLRPDVLFETTTVAKKLGMNVVVSTNGTLLDEELIQRISQSDLRVQISVDGASADTHDAIRGQGQFNPTIDTVRRCVQSGLQITTNMVVHRGNLREVEAFLELSKSLGVAHARFIPLKRIGAALDGNIEPVNLPEMIQHVVEMLARRTDFHELIGQDAVSILADIVRLSQQHPTCGTGSNTLLLDSDGRVYPCPNLCDASFAFGSVRDPGFSLAGLWKSQPSLDRVRQQTDVSDPFHPCSRCAVRYWCRGGCSGETYAQTGRLKSRATQCRLLYRAFLDIIWVLADPPMFLQATRSNSGK